MTTMTKPARIHRAAPDGSTTADWRDQAACKGVPGDFFFPAGSTGPYLLQIEEAKSVCRRCPVMDRCLAEALRIMPEGIWGGTTDEERKAARRRAQRRPEAAQITSGRSLAVNRGASVLHLVRSVADIPTAAEQLGATRAAVTFAVRLLNPDLMPPGGSLTTLEQILAREDSLRTLRRAGRPQDAIARAMGCSPTTLAAALAILGHRDQYDATRAVMAGAA